MVRMIPESRLEPAAQNHPVFKKGSFSLTSLNVPTAKQLNESKEQTKRKHKKTDALYGNHHLKEKEA